MYGKKWVSNGKLHNSHQPMGRKLVVRMSYLYQFKLFLHGLSYVVVFPHFQFFNGMEPLGPSLPSLWRKESFAVCSEEMRPSCLSTLLPLARYLVVTVVSTLQVVLILFEYLSAPFVALGLVYSPTGTQWSCTWNFFSQSRNILPNL